jgi:hypothetical protein
MGLMRDLALLQRALHPIALDEDASNFAVDKRGGKSIVAPL